MSHNISKVLIVGAGPVGLLTALMLGQKGIPVEVFEASNKLDDNPRGLAYGPAASRVLRKAGILDEVIQNGFLVKTFAWRKPNGEEIAGLEFPDTSRDETLDPMVVMPVGSLSKFLLEKLQNVDCVDVHWEHRVKSIGQDDGKAWIEAEHNGESKSFTGDFVVGGDGANSAVRRSLFEHRFPGYTWPTQMMSINLYYDFDRYNWSDSQWIIHPKNWFLASKINTKGLWRVAYCESLGYTKEQLEARVAECLRVRLPGNPEPEEYRIEMMQPYRLHQRCAERMRVGRVLLAGDAAHLCNTMGGLGLTTGISDVGSLTDCLLGIHSGEASMDILELYDKMRRRIFYEHTHPTSVANLARLVKPVEDVIGKDEFFDMLEQAKNDPELAREMSRREQRIGCDMTAFYDAKEPDDIERAAIPGIFEGKEAAMAV